ncbi:MAG: hypothetical protein RL637_1631 [Pseudomonadota bacterium]|jgi:23S rRNA (cytosine1962-C5)-methyltransferase
MTYPEIVLKKHEDKRLRQGHLWVFSNEIDTERSQLELLSAGDLVSIRDAKGAYLGTAYFNPHTLICARLLSASIIECNTAFFKQRLLIALALRQRLFSKPYYRLIFGESDGLPGLVIDRFNQVFAVQMTTMGIERQKNALIEALIELFSPKAIILKNDTQQRQLENLPLESIVVYGDLPNPLIIEENNTQFSINIVNGQKTGWFYDHRDNRARCAKLVDQQQVLDLFCYVGAWGILAATSGAKSVTCVDSSETALAIARTNAELNQVESKTQFVRQDVFDFLKMAKEQQQRFDVIILDPPALIKRKKDFKNGYEAYRRLNYLAMQLLSDHGILISASCSYHLTRDNLHEILRGCSQQLQRHLVFFAEGNQAGDHPIHPALTETAYLKTFFCSVSRHL